MVFVLFQLILVINLVIINSLVINRTVIEGNVLENGTSESTAEFFGQFTNSSQAQRDFKIIQTEIVPHPETKRFRSKDSSLHERYLDKSLLELNLRYCQRSAKCTVLKNATCMGVKLPYYSSTLDLTNLTSEEQVQEKLQLYQYLRYIPKCWAVIQPFLCALYMPKCINDVVDLPSKEMCKITLGPCKIIYDAGIFPEFMRCDDEELFPSKCKNDIHELKFNTTSFCMEPLVRTDQPYWFYPGKFFFTVIEIKTA